MTGPLSLAVVGCGRIVENGYLPALAALTDEIRLAAVADPDPRRRIRVAERARGTGHGDVLTAASLAEVLEKASPDAFVLASPATTHVDDARTAAEANLPVLVEKPPAPDAVGAAALAALRPRPWVGFNRRFDADVAAVRRAAPASGDVALDLTIHYRRAGWSPYRVADDVVTDLGPHLVDLALWLTGSNGAEVTSADLTPERARIELSLERGRATISAATDRPHRELIALGDGSGRELARHERGGLRRAVTDRLLRRDGLAPLVSTLRRQLLAFAEVTRTGLDTHPTLGTAADGLVVMELLDAVRAAPAPAGHPRSEPVPREP